TGAEKAGDQKVVPAARRKCAQRAKRHGHAEREELACLSKRETRRLEPVSTPNRCNERHQAHAGARDVSRHDGSAAPTEGSKCHRSDAVGELARGAGRAESSKAQVARQDALGYERDPIEEHAQSETRQEARHAPRVDGSPEPIAE